MHGPILVIVHADRIGSGYAFIGFLSNPTKTAKAVLRLLSNGIDLVYDLYINPIGPL
jgi:hypothetical protein